MHVSLTPQLEAQVKAKVESGLYNNASEVVREALRFMEMNEEWIAEARLASLRQQISTGLAQLDEGQGIAIESRESLSRLMAAIKAEA